MPITMETTTIISSASAKPTLAWPSRISLVSAERMNSGVIGLPWLTSTAAVA